MKMKKKALFLMMVPLVLAIASCGGGEGDSSASQALSSEASIDNQKEVDNLKSLLAKQDLSPFNEKTFFADYKQNFSVYTNSLDDDDGTFVEFINYNGLGNVGYYYDADKATYEELIKDEDTNTFDIMCQGFGYYGLTQYATINSFLNDEFEEKQDHARSSFAQRVQAQFDETNLQIENYYIFADYFDEDNADYRTFNGTIEKSILFDAITTKALSDIFSRVNVYDGPGFCETVDALYYQICLALLESNDKEISEFIINNNVEFAESEDYSEIAFELKEETYLEQLADRDVIPGAVKGTLYLNKETKELENFEYRIIHIEETADYEANHVHTASMAFSAMGYSHHGKREIEPSMPEDPTVFTNPDDFIEQVVEQVIPGIAF